MGLIIKSFYMPILSILILCCLAVLAVLILTNTLKDQKILNIMAILLFAVLVAILNKWIKP